jgi:hypothetical protein
VAAAGLQTDAALHLLQVAAAQGRAAGCVPPAAAGEDISRYCAAARAFSPLRAAGCSLAGRASLFTVCACLAVRCSC